MGWKLSEPGFELWLDICLTQVLPEFDAISEKTEATLECTEILKDLNFVQKLRHLCDLLVLDPEISSFKPQHVPLCIMYLFL